MKRRYNLIKAEKLDEMKKEQETINRKQRRNEQREELRIALLTDEILEYGILNSTVIDQPRDAFIFDIGDPIAYKAVSES